MGGCGVRTLYPQPCVGGGVSSACLSILRGAVAAGFDVSLHTARIDVARPAGMASHAALPGWTRHVGHRLMRHLSEPLLYSRYLSSLSDGDVAYAWPGTPLWLLERLHARGIPIAVESINTLMSWARPVLDAAYDALGLAPAHGITDARIADQQARYALATTIFAPSPATEAALAGTPFAASAVPASYGTWVPETLPERARMAAGRVNVLFAGNVCVRKGAHVVLGLWRDMPAHVHLRLVGEIEPGLRRLFADVLDRPNVSWAGYTTRMRDEYTAADLSLLPSLEEGDPLVTYESAAHAVPMIATPMGAGRLGAEAGVVTTLASSDPEELRNRILGLAADAELRRAMGDAARAAVFDYDWAKVGRRRFQHMARLLEPAPAYAGPRWVQPRLSAKFA